MKTVRRTKSMKAMPGKKPTQAKQAMSSTHPLWTQVTLSKKATAAKEKKWHDDMVDIYEEWEDMHQTHKY